MKAIREAEWWRPRPGCADGQGSSPHPLLGQARLSAMRLVFAGTPAAAVPSLRRAAGVAGTRSSRWSPGRTPRPAAAARSAPARSQQRGRAAGIEVLKPRQPREPDFLDRLRAARARLLPGRRLRRAAPAGRPGHPRARLGQPALLAAAGLARRRAGAARDPARRRDHRRLHLPHREELDAGPVFGVVTEPSRPTDTAGDLLARLAESGAELLVATHGRHRVRRAGAAPAACRRRQPGAEDHGRRRAGALGAARLRRSTGRSAPARPRRGRGRMLARQRVKLGPRARDARRPTWRPAAGGAARAAATACRPAPAPRRCSWATCSRTASGGCAPPTGPAGCAWTPGARPWSSADLAEPRPCWDGRGPRGGDARARTGRRPVPAPATSDRRCRAARPARHPGGRGRASARPPWRGRPARAAAAIDPARRVAFDVARGGRAGRVRQPAAARAARAARPDRPGRRARDRADVRHAARAGHL